MLPAHKILLRYKTLDECFRSSEKWTLKQLIELCSKVLNEKISKRYEKISKRSIQADIQFLRDYDAPIIVIEKKFYTYADKDFSFLNSKIPERLEQQLSECIDFVKEMQIFPKYEEKSKEPDSVKKEPIYYDKSLIQDFFQNGFCIYDDFYTNNELRNIEKIVKATTNKKKLLENDKFISVLLNAKLKALLKKIDNRAFLVDAIWSETQEPFECQQNLELPMLERNIPKNLTLWGYPATENYEKIDKNILYNQTFSIQIYLRNTDVKTGALQVIQGSHKRELSPLEISLIKNNTTPMSCNVQKGGIVAYSPMLIKQIAPSESPKLKPSITLWFSSYSLPVQYIWNNKVNI